MPAIVAFPHVVEEALHTFGDLFANDGQRRHFAEYLTGLYVAEARKGDSVNNGEERAVKELLAF